MTRLARQATYFAIGIQLAGVALFAWMWSVTGEGFWLACMGWCVFWGASHVAAIRALGKKGEGVKA